MKKVLGIIGLITGGIILIVFLIALNFGATWLGIEWRGFFGEKEASMQYEVFKEATPYREGKNQQLADLYYKWNTAKDNAAKAGIESTVRHRFGDFPTENVVDTELKTWLENVKQGSIKTNP